MDTGKHVLGQTVKIQLKCRTDESDAKIQQITTHTVKLVLRGHSKIDKMKKVNKQCLLDTPRTVRVSEKTWQVIVRTRRP